MNEGQRVVIVSVRNILKPFRKENKSVIQMMLDENLGKEYYGGKR